jgi:DNA-binding transcriptional MerR regulator
MTQLSIGDLAKVTATNVETIRYYEKIGLMPPVARTAGNHRAYDTAHRDRLAFIRHSRELGFNLKDIRALLELSDLPDASCAKVDGIARRHLDGVRCRIARLKTLENELERMIGECHGGTTDRCRVIEVLADHDLCQHHQ